MALHDDEILAIAEKYGKWRTTDGPTFYLDGTPTGGTYTLTQWDFCSEELLAFARNLIEAAHDIT